MNRATAPDQSTVCVVAAVLRLEEYQDEVAQLLEQAGLSESQLDEILLIVTQLATEMYSRGRSFCSVDFSQN